MGPVDMSLRDRTLPRLSRRIARHVLQPALERLDPAPATLARRLGQTMPPPVALVAVYRRRFAAHVAALDASVPGGRSAFWALDEPDHRLAAATVGRGPGERLALLNRLAASLDLGEAEWLLVADDDVRFKRGSPTELARAAAHWALDLSQPAHAWDSHVSVRYTRRRMLTVARRTGWVEQGPILLLSPVARRLVLPFPSGVRWPAWGIEAQWSRMEREGLRLGIVDAVTMVHLQDVNASGYSLDEARRQRRELLRGAGFSSEAELRVDRERWRPWAPPPRD